MAECFGILLAADKMKGPATVLSFLVIVIDTVAMESCLPEDGGGFSVGGWKVDPVSTSVASRETACQIMPMGRVFNCRLAVATAGFQAPGHHILLTREHRADLLVWESFLYYNGRSVWLSSFYLDLFTDGAGSLGYGAGWVYQEFGIFGTVSDCACSGALGFSVGMGRTNPC